MTSYNPDDLGLDLLHAQSLPECAACRKKSDGARTVRELKEDLIYLSEVTLCGRHYEWRGFKPIAHLLVGRCEGCHSVYTLKEERIR